MEIIQNQQDGAGDVLVMHGDAFDWIERAPDGLQAVVVCLATWHASGGQDLSFNDEAAVAAANRLVPEGDTAVGIGSANLRPETGKGATRINVVNGQLAGVATKFFEPARALAVKLRDRGHNVRAVVVGHTHWRRIVVGPHVGGGPFALLDAGARIGRCRFDPTDQWAANVQLGVMVGDDLRVYQLGWSV